MEKLVITIDLNPLSRTAQAAHISIVDNLTRAVANMIELVPDLKNMEDEDLWEIIDGYDNSMTLIDAVEEMKDHLIQKQNELFGPEDEPQPDPEVIAAMEKRAAIAKRVRMRGADLLME
jgi:4-phosphopantoate--beta-alanine ligase